MQKIAAPQFVDIACSAVGSLLIWLIIAYRNSLRMLFLRTCNFWPSCSQYAQEALRKHGLLMGLKLAALRLVRCHPWTDPQIDPVP